MLFASQSFAATVTGLGGALTPPGTTSGVVTFPASPAAEPGTVIPGGTVPDVNVPAVLGYNTQITNITMNNAQHTFASDLDLRLVSPNGVVYTFNTDNGGSTGLDVASDVIYDIASAECADSWTSSTSATQPENGMLFETTENNCGPLDTSFDFVCNGSVAEIQGDEVNGVWTLEVTDDAGGDTGNFDDFSVTFAGLMPPAVDSSGVPIDPANCITVPGAPVIDDIVPARGTLTVFFSPPASDGGAPITNYLVTCNSYTASGPASPIVLTGLPNGTNYNCTVQAENSVGFGPTSVAVAGGTPAVPVPTLSIWGLMLLVLGLVLGTHFYSRQMVTR